LVELRSFKAPVPGSIPGWFMEVNMENEDRAFSDDIKINKFRLEIECEKHSASYYHWANRLAEAKSKLNEDDDYLKLISAQRELSIRNNWLDSYGKQTEGAIKAVLETDETIIKAKKTLSDSQRDVNHLIAAVSAMDHRKSELDNLVTLLVKGFYSAPNGGKREGTTEAVERQIRKNLNSKE
jgi:hypothetical protein